MRVVIRFVLSSCLVLGATVARATDANLDPSFGTYGWTSFNPSPGFDVGSDVAIQADGRIVVAGSSAVARFTSTGALDGTFGTGGVASLPAGAQASGVAIQPDGAIVVVGATSTQTPDPKIAIFRFDSVGSLDGTFGTGGIAEVDTAPSGNYEIGTAVALQGDGGIVAVGWRYAQSGQLQFAHVVAARVTNLGALDGTFGTGGIVDLAMTNSAFAQDVAIQGDGKIVVGGYRYVPYFSGVEQAFMVVRLDGSGALDAGFGSGGVVVTGPLPQGSSIGYAVAVQPDGKIVLGGHAGYAPTALRYLANGSADGAFGAGGVAQVAYPNSAFASMFDMVLRPDGKIVLVGSVQRNNGLTYDTAVVRFNADGSADTTLAPGGRTEIVIGRRVSAAVGAAQQTDGKIVVTGYRSDTSPFSNNPDTAIDVARLGGSCGDAFLDANEQCDDGNNDGLDCCSAGCGYDPAGQICDTVDTSPCTYDTCDGAGTCDVGGAWPPSECLAVTEPLKSSLLISDNADDAKDKIAWKWTRGPEVFYYGQPQLNTAYSFCVFGNGALASEQPIPPGAGWGLVRTSWKLKRDPLTTPGGIGLATLGFGFQPGKSKIKLKGKGPLVGPPSIPLATPVTAQLVSPDGFCFGASYASPITNSGGKFRAKGQ